MSDNLTGDRPIFLQIAEMLEDAILSGAYDEEDQIPSITELSVAYTINPATALKGVNLLVDAGLLYKRRGLGMFVAQGAREKLVEKRKESFYEDYVQSLLKEADKLAIGKDELLGMIQRGYESNGN